MLNKIWFALLLFGILYGFGKGAYNTYQGRSAGVVSSEAAAEGEGTEGTLGSGVAIAGHDQRNLQQMGQDLNTAALNSAEVSVTLCIGLIGIMALWLGLLNIAKDAGLVDALARLLSPWMCWLFPDVPDGHPAQGAMLMNISANMLGLENAATPLGLKAMAELQKLNPEKDTATNAMATFMAINTSNVTIIPFTIIGYRVLSGSVEPTEPIAGIILTTTVTTIVAIVAVRLLQKSPRYALPTAVTASTESSGVEG
jgi:spore maturation protein A